MISSNVILSTDHLVERVKWYRKQPMFAWDIETMGEHRGEHAVNQVVWLSFATAGDAFVLPIGHPNGNRMLEAPRKKKNPETKKFDMFSAVWDAPPKQIMPGTAFEILEPLFFDPNVEKGGHGDIFDFLSVAKYYDNTYPEGPYHDNIVATWILNENLAERGQLGLKARTEKIYKRKYDSENVGRKVEIHGFNKVARYAYLDAKFTWLQLVDNLRLIEEEGLTDIYNLERQTFKVLLDMGMQGVRVDKKKMTEMEVVLSERREVIRGDIYKAAGKKFNLNSPKQKVDVLYGSKDEGNQGLKPWKLTKGGFKKQEDGKEIGPYDYSTDKEALEKFHNNKVATTLLDFQEVDRVLGTYIQGYLGVPDDPKKPQQIFGDNKVYPDLVQYGTVTGRFSCRAPNLQNIPRPDTTLGKEIRALFVPDPGHKLIVADYGQIELVVLAHFVGRGALYDGFFDGIDPHTMTAAMVFGQDPQKLTERIAQGDPEAKGWRQIAKNLNFAIVYGAGAGKVASMSKVQVTQAKRFLATHEQEFPEIYKFKDKAIQTCRSRRPPHLTTLMGRKRRVPAILSSDGKTRSRAERQAINSLIQGSSADLIKTAMIRLNDTLGDTGQLLLSVHDELVTQAPIDKAEKCAGIVREAMVGAGIQKWVDVPLAIDLKIVDNWAEAK